jgi:hypothetical protein
VFNLPKYPAEMSWVAKPDLPGNVLDLVFSVAEQFFRSGHSRAPEEFPEGAAHDRLEASAKVKLAHPGDAGDGLEAEGGFQVRPNIPHSARD